MNIEIIKLLGGWIIYPLVIAYTSIRIAKYHFEKGIKRRYLLAKDKVANDILQSLCQMLLSMWDLVHINNGIANGQIQETSQDIQQRRSNALQNFNNATRQSYLQLGQIGLYYGTEIVDQIAQLQSDLNNMVGNNDFGVSENWDQYRRERLLPLLQLIHTDLKETVFDKIKSFRIYS